MYSPDDIVHKRICIPPAVIRDSSLWNPAAWAVDAGAVLDAYSLPLY